LWDYPHGPEARECLDLPESIRNNIHCRKWTIVIKLIVKTANRRISKTIRHKAKGRKASYRVIDCETKEEPSQKTIEKEQKTKGGNETAQTHNGFLDESELSQKEDV
jgi:hypothetical protein